jgi:hypothetical protein
MDRWETLGVVVLWIALTAWVVQPVPGKGLPVGRRPLRFFLNGRQGLLLGAFLLGVGALVALTGILADQDDALLIALLLGWLGGLYLYHGIRMRTGATAR